MPPAHQLQECDRATRPPVYLSCPGPSPPWYPVRSTQATSAMSEVGLHGHEPCVMISCGFRGQTVGTPPALALVAPVLSPSLVSRDFHVTLHLDSTQSQQALGYFTSLAGTLSPPLPPPRHSPKKHLSEESVTKQVIQTTTSLKETNRNIQGLTSLVKEQKSTGTFKSKFGFKPGIFNNKNAASKNVQKVSKVIDDVDSLSRRADKVCSLVRGLEAPPRRQTVESDYISSGDSNSSNTSGSSISTSDSDPRPARPNLNRVLDCNSNTGPSPVPPAKPLRSADRRNITGALSSPRLRRAAASPLSSPKSPRSPRPRPRLLPKPSSGPSPYRSLATSTAKPLVTSASGGYCLLCCYVMCGFNPPPLL